MFQIRRSALGPWTLAWLAILTTAGLTTSEATEDGLRSLFDGKSTAGWVERGGKALFSVEDGALVGRSVPGEKNSFLWPPGDYADFVLESNTLSDAERSEGWRLLWDGRTTRGWRSAKGQEFPKEGWQIEDGVLSVAETGGAESRAGGDIVTLDDFAAFELKLEFRLTPGANSGIKYYVDTGLNRGEGSAIGLEYQLLDDERHPDAKQGRDGNRTLASLYDLIPAAADKPVRPIGEWNEARIVSTGRHVEHWLNGAKVVEFERGSPEFRRLVAISKYKVWPAFGEKPSGPILLQDHGNRVSFRNIKLRELKPE